MRFLVLFGFLAVGVSLAGESAILASGSRLHVDRHERDGAKTRLYTGAGFIEMETSQVIDFEPDEPPVEIPKPVLPVASAETTPAPVASTPAAPAAAPTPHELADRAADKYGLPRGLVRSVMAAESGFQPHVVSPKGAVGLMQLMPPTAQALGVDPRIPEQNVDAGTRYLRDLLIKYDGQLWHALAAYNAGPGAVEKYKGVPPYRETIHYVNRITRDFQKSND